MFETCTLTFCMTEFGKTIKKHCLFAKSAYTKVKVHLYFNFCMTAYVFFLMLFIFFLAAVIQKDKVQVPNIKYKSQNFETCTLTLGLVLYVVFKKSHPEQLT